jgi:MFS family permease
MTCTLGVFIADTSSLKNRGYIFAYINSPWIITVWIAGPMSQSFLRGVGWRAFYGIFAAVTFLTDVPLFWLFLWNYRKAVNAGLIEERQTRRTLLGSIRFYIIEFDLVGVLPALASIILFLLPFNLHVISRATGTHRWSFLSGY